MSRGHKSADLAQIVIRGMEKAFKAFAGMSQGEWLNAAPEYMVTVSIAHELQRSLDKKGVFLEYSVNEALKEAGSCKRGRPRTGLRRNGRFDILLTRKNLDPWCVIEVKSPVWNRTQTKSDLLRIKETLIHRDSNSTVRCGISAFYMDAARPKAKYATSQESLLALADRIEIDTRAIFHPKDGFLVKRRLGKVKEGVDGDSWMAGCILIEKMRRRSQP